MCYFIIMQTDFVRDVLARHLAILLFMAVIMEQQHLTFLIRTTQQQINVMQNVIFWMYI